MFSKGNQFSIENFKKKFFSNFYNFLSTCSRVNVLFFETIHQILNLKKKSFFYFLQRIYSWKSSKNPNLEEIVNFWPRFWGYYQNSWKYYSDIQYITLGLKTPKCMFLTKFETKGQTTDHWTFFWQKNILQKQITYLAKWSADMFSKNVETKRMSSKTFKISRNSDSSWDS